MEDYYLAAVMFSPGRRSTGARIAKVLRRWTEGGRKAEKEHGRWTEGALVRQLAVANSEDSSRAAPKRPRKASRRWMEGA